MADPNQLTGRALDEAVARAIGTYVESCDGSMAEHYDGWICDGCHNITGSWGEDMPPHPILHAYSADAACISEMLAWLEARGEEVEVMLHFLCGSWHCDFAPRISAVAAACSNADGATLSEALARLVVAVGEASRG